MDYSTMPTIKLQVRRDTASNWISDNTQLLPGELGFELDTGKLKIGKKIGDRWNTVNYINASSDHVHTLVELQTTGTANSTTFLSGSGHWTELDISHITDLQTDLNDKANALHTHLTTNITNFSNSVKSEIALALTTNSTVTGTWTFINPQFKLIDLGSRDSDVVIDLSSACFFKLNITGFITISISSSNLSGNNIINFGLILINAGDNITWSSVFKWTDATAPILTTIGTDILTFISHDNGVSWLNVGQSLNIK